MAKTKIGAVIEFKDFAKSLGVTLPNCQSNSCTDCLYNNGGEKREQLGVGCGLSRTFEFLKEIWGNYSDKQLYPDSKEAKENKESNKKVETISGLYF